MNLVITINSTVRTSNVLVDSLRIVDHVNQQASTCDFTAVGGYVPLAGHEIIIEDGSERIFGGVILEVVHVREGLRSKYEVTCKDFTHYLDRKLVLERYEDTTADAIIEDIVSVYAADFTTSGVDAPAAIGSMAFNRITISECLERLAERLNYSWYVDYFKNIHFYAVNEEMAPFSLTEDGDNHVWSSLRISEGIAQLRNRIFVVGGESESATSRTEEYVADGEQLQFPLAYKFASLPTVTVDSVSQDVGVDGIDEEDDFDCFWSYQQKYIRFKDTTLPPVGDVVAVTGIPLFPIVVNIPSQLSIDEYGEYEFKISDTSIRSRSEAIKRAKAELAAYADALNEGSFTTYEYGLKSGQTLVVDLDDYQGTFIIQSVSLSMRTPTDGEWRVNIASSKTIGVIQFLQGLLRDNEITQDEAETLVNLQSFSEAAEGSDVLGTPSKTSPPYLWGPSGGNVGRWNFATWG